MLMDLKSDLVHKQKENLANILPSTENSMIQILLTTPHEGFLETDLMLKILQVKIYIKDQTTQKY